MTERNGAEDLSETVWLFCVELQIVLDRLNVQLARMERDDPDVEGWPDAA